MSTEALPHTVEPHPITGMYNGKLGMWLFLASEVLLFGALFSTYIFLRVGAPEGTWPHGEEKHLNVTIGMINTFILIVSSVTMVMAWAALKLNKPGQARKYLAATVVLALTFMVLKIFLEYVPKYHYEHPLVPSTSTFYAVYYTLTGLHGLHVMGGVIVIAYFVLFGHSMNRTEPERYANRIECTGLYWHFVDLVWIFLFPVLYLL